MDVSELLGTNDICITYRYRALYATEEYVARIYRVVSIPRPPYYEATTFVTTSNIDNAIRVLLEAE